MKSENKEIFISNELLRESITEELISLLKETKQKLLELRSDDLSGRVWRPKKPHLVKAYRKLIAKIETILRERGCQITI